MVSLSQFELAICNAIMKEIWLCGFHSLLYQIHRENLLAWSIQKFTFSLGFANSLYLRMVEAIPKRLKIHRSHYSSSPHHQLHKKRNFTVAYKSKLSYLTIYSQFSPMRLASSFRRNSVAENRLQSHINKKDYNAFTAIIKINAKALSIYHY